jgi:SRSO17 transposase
MPEGETDLEADFAAFHARFGGLFVRSEAREQIGTYLRGLMGEVARKNCWQMAPRVGQERPDRLQRLLYRTKWEAKKARDILQGFVIEEFGEPGGIGVVDETGFEKCGDRSVGVKRQYTGTAGKVTNCQVGVFVSYASSRGHVFLDRRLYLPEEWCEDQERRSKAYVPRDVKFQTKPQLALEMLRHAWDQGVPMKWVVGDEVYGDAGYLRKGISDGRRRYVLSVSVPTLVWLRRPKVEPEQRSESGRLRRKARLAEGAASPLTVPAVAASWPAEQWERLTVAEGEKGPIVYDWARQRVVESQQGLPGETVWLLVRRSVKDPTDLAYYLSNAPKKTPLLTLAQVAAARWTIEQCFREAKGETGLDEYEVRLWHSWYRHITLVMMAHAWLASVRWRAHEKKGGGQRRGPAGCGARRDDSPRGARPPGDRPSAARLLRRTPTPLVPLSPPQTPAGSG